MTRTRPNSWPFKGSDCSSVADSHGTRPVTRSRTNDGDRRSTWRGWSRRGRSRSSGIRRRQNAADLAPSASTRQPIVAISTAHGGSFLAGCAWRRVPRRLNTGRLVPRRSRPPRRTEPTAAARPAMTRRRVDPCVTSNASARYGRPVATSARALTVMTPLVDGERVNDTSSCRRECGFSPAADRHEAARLAE